MTKRPYRGMSQMMFLIAAMAIPAMAAEKQGSQLAAVAVGTTVAHRPPHRSVRAALPHTAPTSDA